MISSINSEIFKLFMTVSIYFCFIHSISSIDLFLLLLRIRHFLILRRWNYVYILLGSVRNWLFSCFLEYFEKLNTLVKYIKHCMCKRGNSFEEISFILFFCILKILLFDIIFLCEFCFLFYTFVLLNFLHLLSVFIL